jgi:lysyl-tRNA synthetase class 2
LLVGGFEKVYELSRNFRNEGISSRHSPEFTMLELYRAYGDYSDMMKIVEALFSQTAISVMGTTKITYQGVEYDLTPPYPRLSYTELFKESLGFDVWDEENVKKAYKAKGNVDKDYEHWHAVDKVFEWYCEEKLKGPVFIVDYPVEMSPLAKRKGTDERLVERFECFLAGMEVANAFTELNDPIEQRKRFEAQIARIREDGIPRVLDEDYIMALSYGMPPAGGLGVGIDRMVMFFTDTQTIRDVILFPLLRTKG